jgi:phthiocerol/phenolphthiocerol synthesis type-I polyketide synthase E
LSAPNDLDVAVIGMACRFPGAASVEDFWRNLRNGVESISFFSDEELLASGVSPGTLADPHYVKAGGVLDDVESFDARFFGYTAREAQVLDPQQRLFLESAWEVVERAGYDPDRYRGSIGVFGGVSGSTWLYAVMSSPQLAAGVSRYQVMLSTDKDFLASRVAYKLNLGGPAVVVQTACSTSLVAVHMACQSLLAGECDMALAGGVSISVPQKVGYLHEPDGITSRDGRCRPFDAEASGTVRGSGLAVVALKRLADALRDRDQIDAVIKGSAVNNDGGRKVGFTAPGVEGQARVIRAALAMAGLSPADISYVEAHGTATALGDPIEIGALTEVFGASPPGTCAIGSVKSNLGHLDAAAGVAGLVKSVLMLKHRELVPSLHFRRPNPRIDFASGPFRVCTQSGPWPANGGPRRAGVSSFGMGGTNAHVVLEEAPETDREVQSAVPELVVISARTASALERATDALAAHLCAHPELRLSDVAFTQHAGRRAFDHRRALVASDVAEAARALAARDPQRVWSGRADEGRPVAFLFSGQGSQYRNMTRGLYAGERVFRDEVDDCCGRLRPTLGLDLRDLLYPSPDEDPAARERLHETLFTQPALFAVEYALARLWMSWGVVPEAMLGHSVGEYVAACLAGVMSRDDALAAVAERARLMQECPRGAMTAIAMSPEAVRPLLQGGLGLCVVNGPEACVVGGRVAEVERLETDLEAVGVTFGRVPTSHAFHSSLMEAALEPFEAWMARLRLEAPRIPFVSNVTGTWVTDAQATDPAYWVRQLRSTVRFSDGLGTLLEVPQRALLEVGPGQTLVALAKRRFAAGSSGLALPSLRHFRHEQADEEFFLQTAARLWVGGVAIDWSPREARGKPHRVTLPTYPFERERYGIEPKRGAPASRPSAPEKLPVERWLYAPSWRRTATASAGRGPLGRFCVLSDQSGLGSALCARLRQRGADVVEVRTGTGFGWTAKDVCTLDPARRPEYERLLQDLASRGGLPDQFVHLWGLDAEGAGALDLGLLSVLHLGQAVGRRHERSTSLCVVTAEAQDVLGSEPLSPRRAAAMGPCRVIPQEYPLVRCRTVDVHPAGMPASDLADALLAEVTSASDDPAVAYRGRYRWVQSFDEIARPRPEAATGPGLRPRGVYLVTGGLGKVGLALAEHLARAVQARLVLTGRTGLPDAGPGSDRPPSVRVDAGAERIRAVRNLQALGAEVLVVRADAADPDQMRGALAAARQRFGRLHGVIHAAGEMGPGLLRPLAETEPESCERQLRPKLRGAEVLDALLGDEPVDFVLLTSSISTVLGGLGFAAYAAANHGMDAFARARHREGKPWVSVCWDGWQLPASSHDDRPRPASLGIAASEGGTVLANLLALPLAPQVLVSTSALGPRLAQWTRPAIAEALPDAEGTTRHARPELSSVYVPPEDPIERRVAEIWAELLGIDRVGVDDNFFELGGSSLLAVHLMGRLKKEYPVEVSVATLFEAPSVRVLSRVIRSRQPEEPPGLAASASRGQSRKEARKSQRRPV